MVTILGWVGLLLLISTLMPFIIKRFGLWRNGLSIFSLYHHALALFCFMALTLHGLWALTGKRGWGWGAQLHFKGVMLSGIFTWLALLTVVVLATAFSRQKPAPRTHCLVVILLVLLVLIHVF